MNDLTLIYLTANLIPEETAERVREDIPPGYPIVSISQEPISLGRNLCVGKIGSSPYNYYWQILLGAQNADTEFVATCEDDTLYPAEHFTHRPTGDYAYNANAWLGGAKTFWQSPNMNSFGFYISRRLPLIELLEHRFSLFPEAPGQKMQRHFHEPGVFEYDPPVGVETFTTRLPVVAFEHRGTLSGKRKRFGDPGVPSLATIGSAESLYNEYWQ